MADQLEIGAHGITAILATWLGLIVLTRAGRQSGLQLPLSSDVVAGHAEGGHDPVQRRAQDDEAGQDPGPAQDLAGDAEWLEVRWRDRKLLVREEDGPERHRATHQVRSDQRSSLVG